ncbi:methylmalonyl-CoA epimerase [Actinotalea sp. M2MS4P-6]|uniref:VOC family protein n=1 Tax=Actinotalea sp. M2MS4P-6 TaxID=2983762 RepID=UPI0021E38688|nr:VOC family protein [Actinotalea sp. M2MS4P-6]MCV2396035.1 methylmalonyl-CoA epimerase [Actinotalea sp. M2MS4P-6]
MRLRQVAQHADNLDRAAAWYSALLGVPPTARFDPPGLLFFDLDGVRLLLEPGAPSAMLYLEVGDVAAAVERLRASSPVVSEPHVIFRHDDDTLGPAGHDEVQAFVTDPEGNTVGLIGFRRIPEEPAPA